MNNLDYLDFTNLGLNSPGGSNEIKYGYMTKTGGIVTNASHEVDVNVLAFTSLVQGYDSTNVISSLESVASAIEGRVNGGTHRTESGSKMIFMLATSKTGVADTNIYLWQDDVTDNIDTGMGGVDASELQRIGTLKSFGLTQIGYLAQDGFTPIV